MSEFGLVGAGLGVLPHQGVAESHATVREVGTVPEDRFQHRSVALVQQNDHCGVLFTTDEVVHVTEGAVVGKHRSIVFKQETSVAGTRTMKQKNGRCSGSSVRF